MARPTDETHLDTWYNVMASEMPTAQAMPILNAVSTSQKRQQ
jgi:hypothetical protein